MRIELKSYKVKKLKSVPEFVEKLILNSRFTNDKQSFGFAVTEKANVTVYQALDFACLFPEVRNIRRR